MKKRSRRGRRSGGFTLLEVLLVLVILVILGGSATVFFARTQTRAYKRAAENQINLFATPLDEYRFDLGSYPNTQQGLAALLTAPADMPNPDKWDGPYLNKPQIPADPWGNPYQFELVNPDQFRIWSYGPDGTDGSGDEISNI